MEDKTDTHLRTMKKQIEEVQITQKLILERLQQIFPDDASGKSVFKCNCAETLEDLNKRIQTLVKGESQSSKAIKDLQELMEEFRCEGNGNEKTIIIESDKENNAKNERNIVAEPYCKHEIIREDSNIVASRVDTETVHNENKIDSKNIDKIIDNRSSAVVAIEGGAQSSLRYSEVKASAVNNRIENTDSKQIIAESIESPLVENMLETNTFEQIDETFRIDDDDRSTADAVMKPDSNVIYTVPNQRQKQDNASKDIEVRKNPNDKITKIENETSCELPENNCLSKQINLKATAEQTRGETLPSVVTSEQSRLISSPNYTNISLEKRTKFKLVVQREQNYYDSIDTWDFMGFKEHQEGLQILGQLSGIHNVLCVDISASMAEGDAWRQAKTFVTDYIKGLEGLDGPLKEDNVSLVTFGHETRVVQRLTSDFACLRKAFGDIKLGGPSPMYGGLAMAMAAVQSSRVLANVNGTQMLNKVILITDGKPTANNMYAGPDEVGVHDLEEAKTAVCNKIDNFKALKFELFCVPVGNANTEFLNELASKADGKMLDFRGGSELSMFLQHVVTNSQPDLSSLFGALGASGFNSSKTKMGTISSLGTSGFNSSAIKMGTIGSLGTSGFSSSAIKMGTIGSIHSSSGAIGGSPSDMSGLSLADMAKIKEVLEEDKDDHQYDEGESNDLPSIGTRVRRGPDWSYPDSQDRNEPGTIIGNHPPGLQVFVEWDANEHRNVYMCGGRGQYDVLPCDEPRIIPPGRKIAVGCVVIPGPRYKEGHDEERTDRGGAVIKVLSDTGKVQVRWWHNGERGDYSYGEDGDVQLRYISSTVCSNESYV